MIHKHLTVRTRSSRRGSISMELVFTLPLLLTLLLGIFEFSMLLMARGDVIQASRAGARVASLHGVLEEDVSEEVLRMLGPRYAAGATVQTQLASHSGEEVLVSVRIPMESASPNLLWPIGYNLQGREIIAETRMLKE